MYLQPCDRSCVHTTNLNVAGSLLVKDEPHSIRIHTHGSAYIRQSKHACTKISFDTWTMNLAEEFVLVFHV